MTYWNEPRDSIQEEIQELALDLLQRDPSFVREAYLKYERVRIAQARKIEPEAFVASLGAMGEDKALNWLVDIVWEMLKKWEDLTRQGSPFLNDYGVPKTPSTLIPKEKMEPGFIMSALVLNALGRGVEGDEKNTSPNNPYKVLKQALGQEMVRVASLLVKAVEDNKPRWSSEIEDDLVVYDPEGIVKMSDNRTSEKDVEKWNKEVQKEMEDNPDLKVTPLG